MNATIRTRTVSNIIQRGWYRKGQTFQTGEWPRLYDTVKSWHTYQIDFEDNETDTVVARNDTVAMTAFNKLFKLDGNYFTIREVITTYRPIAGCVPIKKAVAAG